MAPRTKMLALKRRHQGQTSTPPSEPQFPNPEHRLRFERLQKCKIGQTKFIDWAALAEIGLDNEVRELVSIGGWDRLLSIHDPVRRDITLEVLASFSFDRAHNYFDEEGIIKFQAFGHPHSFSLTEFAVTLGLYDRDFVGTEEYDQLPIDYPPGITPNSVFRALCGDIPFSPGHSKGSLLSRPAYRVIHAVLSRSVTGRGDGTGALTRSDLLFLHSMTQREPIHLGYVVADFLRHQSQYLRIGSLFAGPYISRLLINMDLLSSIRGEDRISTPAPLGLVTLRLMGLVRRTVTGRYFPVVSSSREAGDAAETSDRLMDIQPEFDQIPHAADAPSPAAGHAPDLSLARLHHRLDGLESDVTTIRSEITTILTNQAEILERLTLLQQTLDEDVDSDSPDAAV